MNPSQIEKFNKDGYGNIKWLSKFEDWAENTIELREQIDIPYRKENFSLTI